MTYESVYYKNSIISEGERLLKKYRNDYPNIHGVNWQINKETFIEYIYIPKCFAKEEKEKIQKDIYAIDEEIFAYSAIVIFLANRVYRILKDGFEEKVYQDALEQEFLRNHLSVIREMPLTIHYEYTDVLEKDTPLEIDLQHSFRPDFYLKTENGKGFVIELKSAWITDKDNSGDINYNNKYFRQTINYMRASNQEYGILLNFYGKIGKEYTDSTNDRIVYNTFFYKTK